MKCPRFYFFRHVLGWEDPEPRIELEFGSAWHKGMAILIEDGTYDAPSILRAVDAFMLHYRENFSAFDDEARRPRDPATAIDALASYAATFGDQDSQCRAEHVEIGGEVSLTETLSLFFKMDAVLRDPESNQVFALEHKSTTRPMAGAWLAQWRQKFQVFAYTHALYCIYPAEEVFGVKVNGMQLPRAKSGVATFLRVPIAASPAAMNSWWYHAVHWLTMIQQDWETLHVTDTQDQLMAAFPKNTENCATWRECQYMDQCAAWPNPLAKCEQVPTRMQVRHWDPARTDTLKEVIKL